MITDYQNNGYRISYQGVSMIENALDNPNLIQIGVSSGCTIMVAPEKDYGIDYLPNGEYKTWKLTGYNTRLNRTEEHYIYARLTRNSDTAMILFSVNEYAIDGSIGGQNPSEYYYYIRIGKITATDKLEEATLDREITLDYGKLSTPAGQTQDTAGWKELFSVTADDLIRPLKKFTSYIVQGTLSIIGKLVINDKQISDVARQVDEGEFSASDELIPTTALLVGKYITKIREYFLSKDREDQTKFLLRLIGGAEFGTYASGISGAKISPDGAAELLNLLLRGALTIGDYQVKKSGAKIDEEGVADLLAILVRDGMESANFSTGALGAGFCLKKDENGDSYLEVDRMLVRKVATFIQLLIQQIKHVGGQIILTPASMSCVKVEDKGDFYRCYFENTDGEKTIEQEFEVGDLARAQTFNVKEGVNENVTNTYYWRAVVGTGDNYIDLSKTDCDAGSTEPKAGDDIVQLGNKSDATRQAAIILSAYGNDAPYFKLYRGINSYSLDGKEFVSFSRSEVMIIADTIRFSSGETIEEYINNVTGGLVVDVETAKKAAEEAQKAAAQASEEASKAVERLDKWSADGVISPTEKQSLKDEIARIDADKTQIANGYAKYNLGTPTNYNNAHTAYRAVLVTLTASSPETITIPSDFATKQTAYYTQRTNALTAISDAARDYAETISNDLTSYKKTVSSQFEQTNNSITAAVTSSKEYTDSAVSGIQIGGINLCLNSNKENEPLQGISPTSRYKILNVYTSIKQGEILESERYYTLSIWYKPYNDSDPNKPFTSFPIGQAPGGDGWSLRFWKRDGTVINEGEYYKWTGTIKAKVGTKLRANPNVGFILEDSSQKTGMSLYKYKLEEGNKPTAWSPAPEDSENALTEYKKEVTAQFSVLEGEISSKVSSTEMTTIKQEILNSAATDATNKINNIQIGGTNLFKNTKGGGVWYANNWGTGKYSLDNQFANSGNIGGQKVETVVKATKTQEGTGDIKTASACYSNISKNSIKGKVIAVSFYAKADDSIDLDMTLTNPANAANSSAVTSKKRTISNVWDKYVIYYQVYANPSNDGLVLYFNLSKININVYLALLKVEISDKATDWSPAPEDADAKYATITTVESMQTEIKQLSNEISLRAYKTEVTAVQNSLNQTNSNLSSLTTRVSEAEIALQPDNIWIGISSKVTTTSKVNNIVPDSCFDDANYSLLYSGGSRVSAATANNSCPTSYCMKSSQRDVLGKGFFNVSEGEKYYISAYINASQCNYPVSVGLGLIKSNDSATSSWIWSKSVAAKTAGWQKVEGYITIPSGYSRARIYACHIESTSNFGAAYVTKLYCYKVDESVNQNYALLTSTEKKLTTFSNINNQTWNVYNITGLKKGDIITVSFEYEASNLNFNTTTEHTAKITCQFGYLYGWAGTNFDLKSNGSGKYISKPITVGGTATETTKDNIFFRLDYISSVLQNGSPIGYFRVWNMKVEKGERATPWSAAPSDYSTTEEIKAGMQITDKGFNFFGQEFNFSGRISVGDLDPTIIEDGYLRASLINADTLVAKTLNAVNTDGVSTLVNKDGLKMTQGSNVLFKLTSNKSTVGTTRYYAQMDLTTVYSDGSTLQGTLTPESLFLRGKTKSTDKTLKTTLMYNGLMVYDENGTGLTVNTKGIQLTYCGRTQGGSDVCSVVHYGKCILSAQISALGSFVHYIGGGIPNVSGTPIEFSVTKTATGTYKVTHNIGDITYHVQVSPIRGTYFPVACVRERQTTYFVYTTAYNAPSGGVYGLTDGDCAVFVNVYYESPLLFTF